MARLLPVVMFILLQPLNALARVGQSIGEAGDRGPAIDILRWLMDWLETVASLIS